MMRSFLMVNSVILFNNDLLLPDFYLLFNLILFFFNFKMLIHFNSLMMLHMHYLIFLLLLIMFMLNNVFVMFLMFHERFWENGEDYVI
jgi:hypothetical protein